MLYTLESIYRGDVGVIERRQQLCFALEPRTPVGVARESRRQNLDGDIPFQLRVKGTVDLTHSACANQGDDFVRSEAGTVHEGQVYVRPSLKPRAGQTADIIEGA